MRADMLPYEYCAELSKMLDRAATFPTAQAIEIIERDLGGRSTRCSRLSIPRRSARRRSPACIRRGCAPANASPSRCGGPGIGPLIAADLRALDWLLIAGGDAHHHSARRYAPFRKEFEVILFAEMNFRNEARYTDIFRSAPKNAKKGVTAPKVYFEYCTEEVMVSEFVSGVWMWELMAAVDKNDQEFLARVRALGIEPKALARKLVNVMQHEVQEELFFHADPHPANLVGDAEQPDLFPGFRRGRAFHDADP